jgi:hypothetical protein
MSFSFGHPPPREHGSIVQQPEKPPKSELHLYQVPPKRQLVSCLRELSAIVAFENYEMMQWYLFRMAAE